jgi:thioredoxin-like negative regulator of GroEL
VPCSRPTETRERFAFAEAGHPEGMESQNAESLERLRAGPARATLVFVRRYRSGASRRMESLVAWVKVTQNRRLRVIELDADRHSRLVEQLGVTTAPSLVLVKDRCVVGRLEGKASGRQIEELIRPHLQ